MVRVDLREVARLAGVSIATVSRVLNNKKAVKPETERRIRDVIVRTGYRPNAYARAMHEKQVRTIGFIVPVFPGSGLENHYFNSILSGILSVCQSKGYDLNLAVADRHGEDTDFLRPFFDRKADSLILVGLEPGHPQLRIIKDDGIPAVLLASDPSFEGLSRIYCENYRASVQMSEYLVSLGHRQIAVVTGRKSSPDSVERLRGLTDVLGRYGVELPPEWVVEGNFDLQSGRDAFWRLFSLSRRPTAVFCLNDATAIGLMNEAEKAGLKIPEDLSVAGFDGVDHANFVSPPLTTMAQPLFQMGSVAAEMAIAKVLSPGSVMETRVFPCRFIEGKSVRRIV